jgi:hypothetical protein
MILTLERVQGWAVVVEVEVTLRLTVSQSVSQYVLVSSTLVGLPTRYYFLRSVVEFQRRLIFDVSYQNTL